MTSTAGTRSPQRIRPRKSLGQHWLADAQALARIVRALGPGPGDTVIEVGPGTGRLTAGLLRTGARVIAVEVDSALAEGLKVRFPEPQLTVINADVLAVQPGQLLALAGAAPPYLVVGNLPYNIGSAVVRHFLYADEPPLAMVVMLQAEVAESVVAGRGHRTYLSIIVQAIADARLLFYLPPSAFRPPPKVRSAVVRIDLKQQPLVPQADLIRFLEFAQAGFAAPRKTLRNSLAVGLREDAQRVGSLLEAAGVNGGIRPADCELEDWARLFARWRQS